MPYRQPSDRRAHRNRYLNTPAGVLRRTSQLLEESGTTGPRQQAAAREAAALLDRALREDKYQREPALWLRRATLLQMDPLCPPPARLHAGERAVRMLELSLETDFATLDVHHTMHLSCMLGLAFASEQQQRPDLARRFLDVIDRLDPDAEFAAEGREQLRERCTPVAVRPYIPPPRPGAISPSALPPAILRR